MTRTPAPPYTVGHLEKRMNPPPPKPPVVIATATVRIGWPLGYRGEPVTCDTCDHAWTSRIGLGPCPVCRGTKLHVGVPPRSYDATTPQETP